MLARATVELSLYRGRLGHVGQHVVLRHLVERHAQLLTLRSEKCSPGSSDYRLHKARSMRRDVLRLFEALCTYAKVGPTCDL
ncbi:hypothetical protein TNCV_144611 [Trichonephila clavipes]|nr:hypothetical protein TNCV_144611 [Trichonephila clavipes]